MSRRSWPIITLSAGSVLVVVLSFTNGAAVNFGVLGVSAQLPEGLLLAIGYVLGVAVTLPLYFNRISMDSDSKQRLVLWEAQDQKLAKQVQSDREKQLEAKVATLEAALDRVLRK